MLHYIIQTIAFQLFFMIVYDLFLRKETFFNWNRVYLLVTSTLSLALPFIKIDRFSEVIPQEYIMNLPQVVIGSLSDQKLDTIDLNGLQLQEQSIWSWELLLYLGMAVALCILIFKMLKLALLIHNNPKRWKDHLLIVKLLNSSRAFSFFHYIFLGEWIAPKDRVSILQHEQVHVEQKHTLDLLLFELLRIVFWFNPLVYMYQNRMAELHEFIADAKAVKSQGKQDYYENLLSQVFETQNLSFINPFFKTSLIKKRIIMLSRNKSNQTQLLKYTLLIPMVLGMLVYTSTNAQDTRSQNVGDKELKEKYYKEIVDMEKQGVTPQDIKERFFDSNNNMDYIQTKEEYYRFTVYMKHMFEKLNEKKINNGEAVNDEMFNKIQNRTYEDYLEHKKTEKAKETWENSVRSRDIRLVVEDHDNYTPKERERYMRKIKMLYSDDNSKQLVITDGESTKTFKKPVKSVQSMFNNSISTPSKNNDDFNLEVPFAVIAQAPVYPGCEGLSAEEQKHCMSQEISRHVQKEFNVKLAADLGLTGRQKIDVLFKIDTNGEITGIRSRAAHPDLEKEVHRVISMLPKMKPGMQKGKAVVVPYALPILFEVKGNATDKVSTPLIEKIKAVKEQIQIQGNVTDQEQKGLDLLLKTVTGTDFDPELVKDIQKYTAAKEKTALMQKISDVFEQIQVQGNISKEEEKVLKGFLVLVTDNGINNPVFEDVVESVEIPFGVIEQIPVYLGCENLTNEEQKRCFIDKVTKHVMENFNPKVTDSLKLTGSIKIYTMFTISNKGVVEKIRVRAPHPDLEKESLRVINMLPNMKPGTQRGREVNVLFSLPIIFEVKE